MFYSHPNKSEEDPVSPLNRVLFFFGPSLESHRAILPMGKKENNYSVNVAVIIMDAYGEYVDKTLRIQVKPALVTLKTNEAGISDPKMSRRSYKLMILSES